MTAPIFGIVGWKDSGKTTLVARLITEFARRRYRVAAVKHAHHGFDVDQPGRDSFRFREAGAREVAVVSARRVAIMHELRDEPEPALEEVLARLSGADLVLVEGFKAHPHDKIETRRRDSISHESLAAACPGIVAVAADYPADAGGLPLFPLDDIAAMADFIAGHAGLKPHP